MKRRISKILKQRADSTYFYEYIDKNGKFIDAQLIPAEAEVCCDCKDDVYLPEVFYASDGQTQFTLSKIVPKVALCFIVFNNEVWNQAHQFTVVGSLITYIDTATYTLQENDRLQFYYQ